MSKLNFHPTCSELPLRRRICQSLFVFLRKGIKFAKNVFSINIFTKFIRTPFLPKIKIHNFYFPLPTTPFSTPNNMPPNKKAKTSIKEFSISYWPIFYLEDDPFEIFSFPVDLDVVTNDEEFEKLVCQKYKQVESLNESCHNFGCLLYTKDIKDTKDDATWERLIPDSKTKIFTSAEIKEFVVGVKISFKFTPDETPTDFFCLPTDELDVMYDLNSDFFQQNGIDNMDQLGDLEEPTFSVTGGTYCYVFDSAILVPSYHFHLEEEGSRYYWDKLKSFPIWTPLSELLKDFPSAVSAIGSLHRYLKKSKDINTRDTIDLSVYSSEQTLKTLKECNFIFNKYYKVC